MEKSSPSLHYARDVARRRVAGGRAHFRGYKRVGNAVRKNHRSFDELLATLRPAQQARQTNLPHS